MKTSPIAASGRSLIVSLVAFISYKSNSFSDEKFRSRTRFETDDKGNSEMACCTRVNSICVCWLHAHVQRIYVRCRELSGRNKIVLRTVLVNFFVSYYNYYKVKSRLT